MAKRNKLGKTPVQTPAGFKFDVHPDVSTMLALEALSVVWGGSLGQAVTGVLDTWAQQSLTDAIQLQACVAQVHPEYAGKPLLTLPRAVFMAGCHRQDLENLPPEGRA